MMSKFKMIRFVGGVLGCVASIVLSANCGSFGEEKIGADQQKICQAGDPCSPGGVESCSTDGTNLVCIGGTYVINPDVCIAGGDCLDANGVNTQKDSTCCTAMPGGDYLACDGTWYLVEAASTQCFCVTTHYCLDSDLDGWGDPLVSVDTCAAPPAGYILDCGDCNDANLAVNPDATEICYNGIDDDCNGIIDDPSICDTCHPDGACTADPPPSMANCYDKETAQTLLCCCDANGGIWTPESTGCQANVCNTGLLGECAAGTAQCSLGQQSCVQNVQASAETCDGLDNDCDGTVDNGNPGGGASCSTGLLGECAAGTVTCQAGVLNCVQNVQASTETCDGLDNDCNDAIDEGNPGGGGACAVPGVQGACAAGTLQCVGGSLTCPQTVSPTTEICNGIDDNCDGTVDEGCTTHSLRFVWTLPVGYTQVGTNVFAVGGVWDNVAQAYTSYWRNLAGVPAFCSMSLVNGAFECTVSGIPGNSNVCENVFHEDVACDGTSFGFAHGGYMYDQNTYSCGNCIGLSAGCGVQEFGSVDVYLDGVLVSTEALTVNNDPDPNTWNKCFDIP